ncbi:MAG: phenylalanine--tRNA ligase subunit beta [Magnetovibrio sp.]|nr:phenylalanine--tRNA ligase subunit beta [Magnetovibrio sp.]
MKFTLSWLKRHLNTEADLEQIAETLTMVGLEVEKVLDRASGLESFVTARVIDVKKHPNAERLSVCKVDAGSEKFQVVCGAPNVRNGLISIFARPGSYIPGTGINLKSAKIRSIESNGMLLSEHEMNLSDNHEGIIELSKETKIGVAAVEVMRLNDPIIEIGVTPNRGDCLGVRGIARDLAATGLGTLYDTAAEPIPGTFISPVNVHLDFDRNNAEACSYFVGRFIKGVENVQSPRWLKEQLSAIGLRPISALVDITNWMTFDLSRPLHVFDASKINGDLRVRLSKKGEKFLGLDGKHYTLDNEMTVICDDNGLEALGGIMGGERSGVTSETCDLFLEAAYFDPIRTAATGRKLNLHSDARFRFERGVDPSFLVEGIETASKLIEEICGGEFSVLVTAGAEPNWKREVNFKTNQINFLGGIDIEEKTIINILGNLGFSTEKNNENIRVSVPPWRPDISSEACLVEEVLRINGYDRIPPVSIKIKKHSSKPVLTPLQSRRSLARRILAARGIMEAVTYSFVSAKYANLFGGAKKDLQIENPISQELNTMRPSILPTLILAAKRNTDRGINNVDLFEVGPQFTGSNPGEQFFAGSGIRSGFSNMRHWAVNHRRIDLFDTKADALALLAELKVNTDRLTSVADAPNWYHPGRSGTIKLGPKHILANFGEIHPRILDEMGIDYPIAAFEVFLDALPVSRKKNSAYRPTLHLAPFQTVERDFAFVVDADLETAKLANAVWASNNKLVSDVSIFDVFEGKNLGQNQKSVAMSVTLQPLEKTLTDEEIETVAQEIIASVKDLAGGQLRE